MNDHTPQKTAQVTIRLQHGCKPIGEMPKFRDELAVLVDESSMAILLMLLFLGSADFAEKISSGKYPAYADYQKRCRVFCHFRAKRQLKLLKISKMDR